MTLKLEFQHSTYIQSRLRKNRDLHNKLTQQFFFFEEYKKTKSNLQDGAANRIKILWEPQVPESLRRAGSWLQYWQNEENIYELAALQDWRPDQSDTSR